MEKEIKNVEELIIKETKTNEPKDPLEILKKVESLDEKGVKETIEVANQLLDKYRSEQNPEIRMLFARGFVYIIRKKVNNLKITYFGGIDWGTIFSEYIMREEWDEIKKRVEEEDRREILQGLEINKLAEEADKREILQALKEYGVSNVKTNGYWYSFRMGNRRVVLVNRFERIIVISYLKNPIEISPQELFSNIMSTPETNKIIEEEAKKKEEAKEGKSQEWVAAKEEVRKEIEKRFQKIKEEFQKMYKDREKSWFRSLISEVVSEFELAEGITGKKRLSSQTFRDIDRIFNLNDPLDQQLFIVIIKELARISGYISFTAERNSLEVNDTINDVISKLAKVAQEDKFHQIRN